MEEEFISLDYFSLQLTGDMFVLYNTYENIIVSLSTSMCESRVCRHRDTHMHTSIHNIDVCISI